MQCKIVPANAGEALTVVGDVLVLKLTEEDTGGRFALGELFVRPGGGPPPHLHRKEDELFYVLDGEVDFFRDDTRYPARAGSSTWAPRNGVHTFKNVGSSPMRALVLALPCNFEHFYRECGEKFTLGSELPAPTQESIQKLLSVAPKYGLEIRPEHQFSKTASDRAIEKAFWVLGERVVVNQTSKDTGGNFCLCTIYSPPGEGLPPHAHRDCDEIFFIVEGTFEFRLGDRTERVGPGAIVYIPQGNLHCYKNVGQTQGKFVSFHTPGGFERFFEEAGTVCTDPNEQPPAARLGRESLISLLTKHGMELPSA